MRANRLARLLRLRGARPKRIVAIALERSPELIVAILATLKAGAAYLPLDADHPPARSAALLHDSGAQLLVSSGSLADRLCIGQDTVRLDTLETESFLRALPAPARTDRERNETPRPPNPANLNRKRNG